LGKEANIEKVAKALEAHFTKKRAEQEKAAAEDEAKEMEKQFSNPVKIELGNAPVKGNKDARVTIIEFSDFQCPFCQRGAQTMEEVIKAYPNDVKVAFKNLPLPFHPQAKPAAIAALAAHEQGKFWEFYSELFANQQNLSDEFYTATARKLGLDAAKFAADLKSEKIAKQVEDDMQLANSLGVRGTPGFFVNGVQVRGAREVEYFKQIIDRHLAKK
jgi:protein-disulfide isomerase